MSVLLQKLSSQQCGRLCIGYKTQRGMVWWAMVIVFKLLDNKLWFQTRQSRFVQAAR